MNQQKTLYLIITILAGLFCGSLLFEAANTFGYASIPFSVVNKGSLFESGNRTWVSYNEPILPVKILSDPDCSTCSPESIVSSLSAQISPTLISEVVDIHSQEGERLVEKFSLSTIPSVIFGNELKNISTFSRLEKELTENNQEYLINNTAFGMSPREFIQIPEVSGGFKEGKLDNPDLTIVKFGSITCPYSAKSEKVDDEILKQFGDTVQIIYKHYNRSDTDEIASQAAECAEDQGLFTSFMDEMMKNQQQLNEDTITSIAIDLSLDQNTFSSCLSNKIHEDQVQHDTQEGTDLGINGTPTYIVGNIIVGGYTEFDRMKQIIEHELEKK